MEPGSATAAAAAAAAAEREKFAIKNIMERTPSVLKSKFLSVLGNSSDIITELSNKIDAALSLSASSEETETTANRNEAKVRNKLENQRKLIDSKNDDFIDYDAVDFDYRKVKERRAHEEIMSGGYRHPMFVSRRTPDHFDVMDLNNREPSSRSSSNYSNSIDSPSPRPDIDELIEGELVTPNCPELKVEEPSELAEVQPEGAKKTSIVPSNSGSTSENDPAVNDLSYESAEVKMWLRDESCNSVPSWASSISLDSASEEAVLEFMRRFVDILFTDPEGISLELKAEFGQYARAENGRLWFARLINVQRAKTKCVGEMTFFALIQYFAIILFECMESDDFSPAKTLMNMCFTFYHEVEVPGCEPYPEYLYTYMRDQPIWHSLRFWNAAFFEALHSQRLHRPVPPTKPKEPQTESSSLPESDNDAASVASNASNSHQAELEEDKKFQQNITFGQLGTFTCNMHAFGLSRDLTTEFLRKQCIIANLSKDQVRLLQDNVYRMYRETDPWRV